MSSGICAIRFSVYSTLPLVTPSSLHIPCIDLPFLRSLSISKSKEEREHMIRFFHISFFLWRSCSCSSCSRFCCSRFSCSRLISFSDSFRLSKISSQPVASLKNSLNLSFMATVSLPILWHGHVPCSRKNYTRIRVYSYNRLPRICRCCYVPFYSISPVKRRSSWGSPCPGSSAKC